MLEVAYIDPDNMKRDLNLPALRGLLEHGYVVATSFLIQRTKEGPAELCLLLLGPPPAPPARVGERSGDPPVTVTVARSGFDPLIAIAFLLGALVSSASILGMEWIR